MNSLKHIFDVIENENDSNLKKSNKATFYTLINYLEASSNGISRSEIQDRFLRHNSFSPIFKELVESSVIEQSSNGIYHLNNQVKKFISPIFEELISMVYKHDYVSNRIKSDPTFDLLYNCRSQVFSS